MRVFLLWKKLAKQKNSWSESLCGCRCAGVNSDVKRICSHNSVCENVHIQCVCVYIDFDRNEQRLVLLCV